MTAKVNMIFVFLEKDIREDEIHPLLNAIKMLKGVLDVEQNIANTADALAQKRLRDELGKKLLQVVYPDMKEET